MHTSKFYIFVTFMSINSACLATILLRMHLVDTTKYIRTLHYKTHYEHLNGKEANHYEPIMNT